MTPIEDERIRFYLMHRTRIQEWAKIEESFLDFANRFYLDLGNDLRERVQGSEELACDDLEIRDHEWRAYRGIGLRRSSWPKEDADPDVRFEWRHAPDLWQDQLSVCGVRGWNYEETFPAERCPSRYPKKSKWWLAYRHVGPPTGEYWESDVLKEHRDHVLDVILTAWRDLAPLVDEALQRGGWRPSVGQDLP